MTVFKRSLAVLLLTLSAPIALTAAAADPAYRVVSRIQTASPAVVQVLRVDEAGKRLFAGRDGAIDVYDLASGAHAGSIDIGDSVGGIALAPDLKRGYATGLRKGTLTVFDLESLAVQATTPLGGGEPREVEYDAKAGRVYVSHNGNGELSVVDARSGKRTGGVSLGGRLRQSVADGRGKLFVADEARSVLHVVDTASLKSLGEISVWPGKAPTALVNDTKERRVYVACGNGRMIVVDPDPGQMLGIVPTGSQGEAGIAMQVAPARLVRLYMPTATGNLDVVQNAKLTPTLDATVPVGTRSTAAAFGQSSGHAYVAGDGAILVVGK